MRFSLEGLNKQEKPAPFFSFYLAPISPPPRSPRTGRRNKKARSPSFRRPSMASKLAQKFMDSYDDSDSDDAPHDAGCVRAVLAELVLTFLFVFTGVSAAMAAGTFMSPLLPAHILSGQFLLFLLSSSPMKKPKRRNF